jgi:hypothetical protein
LVDYRDIATARRIVTRRPTGSRRSPRAVYAHSDVKTSI